MKGRSGLWVLPVLAVSLPGCLFVPKTELNSALAQSRALAEQNRAQLAEIENLKLHARELEDRVITSEKQLAALKEQSALDQKQLENLQQERAALYGQLKRSACGGGQLPAEVNRQLIALSQKYPALQYDPETGISKLDSDILFDSGEAVLKPGAERLIDELVRIMKSPAAGDLRIMVAGHTDNQLIAGREVRDKYPNNFHLSTARALAVADRMKRAGLSDQRMAVAGFGPSQPIASNSRPEERQKNRRVEIFIMPPEVPVIGWSDSMPSVYKRR